MKLYQFPVRPRTPSIAGLFWAMPEAWQRKRIQDLSRTFSPETIATLSRRSLRDVNSIIEACQ